MSDLLATWAALGALFACVIGIGVIGVLLDNAFGDDRETMTITVSERVRR